MGTALQMREKKCDGQNAKIMKNNDNIFNMMIDVKYYLDKAYSFTYLKRRWSTIKNALIFFKECIVLVVVQSLNHVQLFVPPWPAAHQAHLSFTTSQCWLKFISTESVMLSNNLILYHPFILVPSIFYSTRTFSSESALHIRWPKY